MAVSSVRTCAILPSYRPNIPPTYATRYKSLIVIFYQLIFTVMDPENCGGCLFLGAKLYYPTTAKPAIGSLCIIMQRSKSIAMELLGPNQVVFIEMWSIEVVFRTSFTACTSVDVQNPASLEDVWSLSHLPQHPSHSLHSVVRVERYASARHHLHYKTCVCDSKS